MRGSARRTGAGRERGQRVALGHGLAELGDRRVVVVVAGLGLAAPDARCLRGGQLLRSALAIWASQVRGLLALGREAEEPEAGQSGRDEQHDDDDEAVASGHGVVVAAAVWAPAADVVGLAKKRVIENCG